jgi:hypothetical protein
MRINDKKMITIKLISKLLTIIKKRISILFRIYVDLLPLSSKKKKVGFSEELSLICLPSL